MLMTSDGKAYVWGFFVSDGAECCDLHSLHATEDSAQRAIDAYRASPQYWPTEELSVATIELKDEITPVIRSQESPGE
jgi:hypothetical protein